MSPQLVLLMLSALVLALVAAWAAAEYTRRRALAERPPVAEQPLYELVGEALAAALAELRAMSSVERDAAVRAALEQASVLQREQLGAAALSLIHI